jgi:hypothetical protein
VGLLKAPGRIKGQIKIGYSEPEHFIIRNHIYQERRLKMAEIHKQCDEVQGFQWMSDRQEQIGHITMLKIGETEFKADMAVTNPEEVKGDPVDVVGVASSIAWGGGIVDPIAIRCQISNKNKQELAMLLFSEMTSTAVELKFNVYSYDKDATKYFMSFHTKDTVLNGIVAVQGGERLLYLEDEPHPVVEKPENYGLSIEIVPEDETMDLHVAVSDTHKVALQWGIKRTA